MKRGFLTFLLALLFALPAPTQAPLPLVLEVKTGDDIPLVAAWAPDSQRLAYATDKEVEAGEELYYRGEVWITDLADKQKRIVDHRSLPAAKDFFTLRIEALAWAPNGQALAVELVNEKKKPFVLLYSDKGKEIKLGSLDTNVLAGYGAGWLGDGQTLAVLQEAAEPRVLHKVSLIRVVGGRRVPLFAGRTFSAVAWLPRQHKAALVEQDAEFSRPPQLVLADLEKGITEALGELAGYLGGLRALPDESAVSYFVGQNKLAVRAVGGAASPRLFEIPFSGYEWAGSSLFFLEPEQPGARRGWLMRYDAATAARARLLEEPILNFWVSPDGRHVAVLTAELEARLKVYRLPSH